MYKIEFSDIQHEQLLNVLLQSKSKILISGYDSDMYNSMLKDWNTAEKKTIAQMGLHRTEKIWYNYDMNSQKQISFII